MSNSYVPLYVFLGLLIGVGVVLPLFISSLIDTTVINSGSFIEPLINFVHDGITINVPVIGAFGFNIFFWIPSVYMDKIVGYLVILTYIPDMILIPISIVMFLSLIYLIIVIIRGN